jgi:hypothetical protein
MVNIGRSIVKSEITLSNIDFLLSVKLGDFHVSLCAVCESVPWPTIFLGEGGCYICIVGKNNEYM